MKIKQVLLALDQLANTLLGGMADETLSARAYRTRETNPWRMRVIDALFFWEDNHCYESWLSEVERRQLPSAYRR